MGIANKLLMAGRNIRILGFHPLVYARNKINFLFFKYYAFDNDIVVWTSKNFVLKVRMHDQAAASFLFHNAYSPDETQLIVNYINKNTTFVDIGASYGYFSILAATLGCRRVLAFEPNPLLRPLINDSIVLNNLMRQIKYFPVALSNKCGHARLSFSEFETSSGNLVESNNLKTMVNYDVPCDCLDNYSMHVEDDVLVKIDAEGHEYEILQGGINLLSSKKPIIIWETGHADPQPIIYLLSKLKYKHFVLTEGKLREYYSHLRLNRMIISKVI